MWPKKNKKDVYSHLGNYSYGKFHNINYTFAKSTLIKKNQVTVNKTSPRNLGIVI